MRAPVTRCDGWNVVARRQQVRSGLGEREGDTAAQAYLLPQLVPVLAVGETGRREWTDAAALHLRPAPVRAHFSRDLDRHRLGGRPHHCDADHMAMAPEQPVIAERVAWNRLSADHGK